MTGIVELEALVDRVMGEITPAKIVNFLSHYHFKGDLYIHNPEERPSGTSKFFDFEIRGIFYRKNESMQYQELVEAITVPHDLKQAIGLMFYSLIEADVQKRVSSKNAFPDALNFFHVQEFTPNRGAEEKNWENQSNLWSVDFRIRLSAEYKDQFEKAIMRANGGVVGFQHSYHVHAW